MRQPAASIEMLRLCFTAQPYLAATVTVSYLGLTCLSYLESQVSWMFGVCVCFPVLTQPVVSSWLISQPERDWTQPGEGRGGGTEPINRCLPAQVCWYHLSLSPQQSQHDNNLTYNRSQSPLPPSLAWPGSSQASPSQAGQILLFLFSPAWPAVTANTVLV